MAVLLLLYLFAILSNADVVQQPKISYFEKMGDVGFFCVVVVN